MIRFYLIRHGDTGIKDRDQASEDDLNKPGWKQAQSLAKFLSKEQIDCIYSSSYQRALSTAKVIAEVTNLEIVQDDRLREIPLWHTPADLHDDTSEEYVEALKILAEAREDMQHLFHNLLHRHEGDSIVLVCHGNIIRAMLGFCLKMNLESLVRLTIGHTSITMLRWVDNSREPHYRLEHLNDTCHLG